MLKDSRAVLAPGAWKPHAKSKTQAVLKRLHGDLCDLAAHVDDWLREPPGVVRLAKLLPSRDMECALREAWPPLRRWLLERRIYRHRQTISNAMANAELRAMHDGVPGRLRLMNLARGPYGPFRVEYQGIPSWTVGQPDLDPAAPPPPLALLAGRALEGLPIEFLRELTWGSPRTDAHRREARRFFIHWPVLSSHLLRQSVASKDADGRLRMAVAGLALAAVVHEGDRAWWLTSDLPKALQDFGLGRHVGAPLRRLARELAVEQIMATDLRVRGLLERSLPKCALDATESRAVGPGRPISATSGPERLATFLKKHKPSTFSIKELEAASELSGIRNMHAAMSVVKQRYRGKVADGGDPETATFMWVG
jgi:hypothetical protein